MTPWRKPKRNSYLLEFITEILSDFAAALVEYQAIKTAERGKMPINSKQKGARFERQVAGMFKDFGYPAFRTAQYEGKTGDCADVEGVPYIHLECKHQQKMHLYDWIAQAVRDSQKRGNKPVVIHKQNHKEVLVTMRFDDWIDLYREWEAGHDNKN